MDRKRPLEGNGEASGSNKKLKSSGISQAAIIAQKRAEIAAKVAAMNSGGAKIAAPTPVKPIASAVPMVKSASSTPPGLPDDLAKKIAEAKKKVVAAQSKLAVKDNPYMSIPQTGKNKNRPAEPAQQGAGLKMAAHPLLLDHTPAAPQSKKDRYKPMQPKFASIKANTRNVPTPPPAPTPVPIMESANPYASKETIEGAPKDRMGRNFRFNPKGKYVALADQLRKEAQLEALKHRIAESARKAGLDSDMGIEKSVKRAPPPEAEWWDAALLPNKTYDDLSYGIQAMNIKTSDSPITIYIQHPIPIPAPGDKDKVALKPMKLTKKEQKKMRKLRRAGELQDKRDRIRMGLLPPDPPKVRLANLMRVLTSDAVQDPTRVEARVRREVAMRKHGHEKMNAERKLTDEQRREKVENKKSDEEKKGIHGAVFKVKTLTDGSHRFKVRKNAEQMNLSGLCIFNPNFSMIYVEGAAKFIRNYKRLMMHRIVWTEASRPRGGEEVELQEDGDAEGDGKKEEEVSLEDNKCWERAFSSFKAKSCPTDSAAKEVLGERLKGYWDQAKNWKGEEEELF
ncbi:pre-mRNA processing factor 3-domain-containing protein [Desarmillaria tabescens]|uniref:Pre-mRNA processing factor 3-domain-containing protein n=1 Tax=Armillaria tabescens TaxID=1929756 RepID=A0AA39NKD3_ARMTA|nr:pre-mRNA processing factor 3-domain-containing protein [Desarmillaria tabescens]KAK0467274.1 pre-mRNA processing factor 3-domain-containing protein [Desarmillaria tabescens]